MNDETKQFIDEIKRCMISLMENGEFPPDTCPADIYTACIEIQKGAKHENGL
jgi:hypothetical protein